MGSKIITRTPLGTIMPGDRHSIEARAGRQAEPARPYPGDSVTALKFREVAGAIWTRWLDGELRELRTSDTNQQIPDKE
jgi:hypothetical protein